MKPSVFATNGIDLADIFTIAFYAILALLGLIISYIMKRRRGEELSDPWFGKYKVVALLLAVFLGNLGIHRMYIRRPKTGCLELVGVVVVSWLEMIWHTGILELISIIAIIWCRLDFFLILFGGLIPAEERVRKEDEGYVLLSQQIQREND